MSNSLRYKLLFRGETSNNDSRQDSISKLAKLFKLPSEKAATLFDGKTRTLKKGLDKLTAAKYQAAFKQAGLKAYFKEDVPASNTATTPATPEDNTATSAKTIINLQLSAVGDDLLRAEEKQRPTRSDIETNHLSAAEVGCALSEPQAKTPTPPIDFGHLQLDTAGTALSSAKQEVSNNIASIDASLAEPGSRLSEASPTVSLEINSNHLHLAQAGADLQDARDDLPVNAPDTSHLSIDESAVRR
ncbi:hypothetical protein [Sinobacterium caligoides]|nr:hypothetical protein [Sinobacterium caligoides]